MSGVNWGLCCNSVTFIDWFHSLINREKMKINTIELEDRVYKSKRAGYREIFGTYKIVSNNGHSLTLNCRNDRKNLEVDREINIDITNSEFRIEAKLLPRQLKYVIKNCYKTTYLNEKIDISYQSERTASIIESLVNFDTCNLVPYKTSAEHHLLVYGMFKNIFIANGYDIKNGLPIT